MLGDPSGRVTCYPCIVGTVSALKDIDEPITHFFYLRISRKLDSRCNLQRKRGYGQRCNPLIFLVRLTGFSSSIPGLAPSGFCAFAQKCNFAVLQNCRTPFGGSHPAAQLKEGSENHSPLLNYLVRLTGFEPVAYCLEGSCSIQLSYRRATLSKTVEDVMVGARGFEPPALWSQTRCATRLRYAPTSGCL